MSQAMINGQHLYFEDSGGDGLPVLFSHGFLMDHSMFDPQVAALRSEFRCITWDERGHGASSVDGPFTYWDSARDALALLDHLGIDSAVFVGMSQGGFLSMRAALIALSGCEPWYSSTRKRVRSQQRWCRSLKRCTTIGWPMGQRECKRP
jgi:3-oxoadipate enol-lactonase